MALKRIWPVWLVLALSTAFIGWRLFQVGGDGRQLAEIGSRFSQGDPLGTEGYDGQFVLYMAEELAPLRVATKLDVPAYRYQRILLPLLARVAALGRVSLVPWTLLLVNLAGHLLGVWALCELLRHFDKWVGFSLLYGLWAGLLGGVGTDLHEPLAYGLVVLALWLRLQKRQPLAIIVLGFSLLAKETTIPFLVAFILVDLFQKKLRQAAPYYSAVLLGYALWQWWLWRTFGQMGLGSGGSGASSFEWVPLMGFFRIANAELKVFGLYLLLFGPGIVLPTIWGGWRSLKELISNPSSLFGWILLLNAAVILVLPYSTFREPFGLVRLATGLVLATILFATRYDIKRPLLYGWFWLAYLPLIL